jgi:2-oxoglutarate ferredoxin oxidoreductase subunit delta
MEQKTALKEETVASAPKTRGRRRGVVRVYDRWCKGCGLCIAFCPQQVFSLGPDGKSQVVDGDRCTACEWCYLHCPDFAISVRPLDGEPRGDT